MLVDLEGGLDPGVKAGFAGAREVGMLAKAAGHRAVVEIAARQAQREAGLIEIEVLVRFEGPRPLARAMLETQHGYRVAAMFDRPAPEPALTVQWRDVAG